MYGNYPNPTAVQPQAAQLLQHPVSASVFPRSGLPPGTLLPAVSSQVPPNAQMHGPPTSVPSRTAEAAAAAKRNKKRKMLPERHERQVPEKIAHLVPESALFNRLLEHERRIDDLLHRKKADISEALNKPEHISKKLRVYVFNTHAHQKAPVLPTGKADPPSWCLTLYGRIVEPLPKHVSPTGELLPELHPIPHSKHHPFTSYLRRVEIQIDPEQYPTNNVVVWDRAKHVGEHKDTLEIRRMGNKPAAVKINLEADWQPQRYQLPKPLAELLGAQYETRVRVLAVLWEYIRQHKLLDPKEPHIVRCDAPLASLFGEDTLKVASLSERLSPLLEPMPPLKINYNIKLNGRSPAMPDCYDIDLQVAGHPHHDRMYSFLEKVGKDKEIESINHRMSSAIQRLNEHRRRHTFFSGFSHSPVDFINALITSQARDLRLSRNANGREFEVEHRTQLFHARWVEDAVMKYLHRKIAAGH